MLNFMIKLAIISIVIHIYQGCKYKTSQICEQMMMSYYLF